MHAGTSYINDIWYVIRMRQGLRLLIGHIPMRNILICLKFTVMAQAGHDRYSSALGAESAPDMFFDLEVGVCPGWRQLMRICQKS